ncbi:MAG TPA: carbon-nitrogen hydrolase family protein [Streptosporangiaceae bacterium]|nr:carbon-nitrogen hydrolase family protein [Streptosporangiaceae bacterium]
MRVALGQIPISSDPQVNLDRVRTAAAAAAAKGAELVVFPEGTQVRFSADLPAVAEPLDGEFCRGLAAAAKSAGLAIIAAVFEPAPDGRVFNTTVGLDREGSLVAVYRKIHLFDALGHRESDSVAPGDEVVIATVGGLRIGFMTCYDVRFPELPRALAAGGAELLVLPAAWAAGTFKEEHWVTLVRARAIENTIWLAAAGQVPDPAERPTHAPTGIGRSMLVDPMGVVRLDLGPAEGLGIGDVDLEETARVRAALPCLANRRQDVLSR